MNPLPIIILVEIYDIYKKFLKNGCIAPYIRSNIQYDSII